VYLTASTGLTIMSSVTPAETDPTDLCQRVEKFNKNDHGLLMTVVSI